MPGMDYYTTRPTDYPGAERSPGGGFFLDPEYIKHASLDEVAVNFVLSVKTRSEEVYQQKKNRMLDFLHHYLNLPRPRKYANQSNVPISAASEAVDAHHHAIMNRFARLNQRPCRVDPTPINPSEANKRIARLVDAKLYVDNMMMEWERKMDLLCKSALIFGIGLARHRFHEEIELKFGGLQGIEGVAGLDEPVVVYQGYTFDIIDPIDYYPAVEKTCINDRHPDVVRYFPSFEQLLEAQKLGYGYFNLDKIEEKRRAVPDYAGEERQRRRGLLGLTDEGEALSDAIEVLECHAWFPLERAKKEGDEILYQPCIITLANGQLIGLKVNPNRSRDNMMTAATIDRVPGSLYGVGVVEKIHPQIHAGNTVLDLILENIGSTVHKMKGVIQEAMVDPSELYTRPDGIIRFKAGFGPLRDVFAELASSPLGPEVFRLLEMFMTGTEKAAFASAVFKGGGAPGIETAQESRDLSAFSTGHNEYYIRRIEDSHIRPSHAYGYQINIDFTDLPTWVRVGSELAGEIVDVQGNEDINQPLLFVGLASTQDRDRTVTIQQAMQLLEISKGHPSLEPLIGRVASKIVETFNWSDLEDFKQLIDIGWKQYTMSLKQQMGIAVQPAAGAGMKTPGAAGAIPEPGTIRSRPGNMTRATTGSEVARNLASFANVGLPGKVGRR